jgi:hypothetical protein
VITQSTKGTTMRIRILAAGGVLALLAALLVDHGDHFGFALTHAALLGLALGAVLGLVPLSTPGGRIVGFVTGFLAAWVGYALRAGFLPDIPIGRAIAAFIVVAVVAIVASATNGWAPLWAGLLGVGALVGSYETAFTTMPTAFTTESVTAATTVALAVALGLLITTITAAFTMPVVEEDDIVSPAAPSHRREIRLPGQRITDPQVTATEATKS